MNFANHWSDQREWRRLLQRERVSVEATESICRLMTEQGVNRKALAERLGCSSALITKFLRGDNNFTIGRMSDIFTELGRSVHILHGPMTDVPHITCADDPYGIQITSDWDDFSGPQYALAA